MFKLHTEAATRGVIYSLCNFIKKRLHHRPFTANVVKFLRSLNLRNIYEWLLLDISMKSFPNEFEKWLWKTKCYGSVMTEHVLAQRLLKSSKLPNQHEQLFQKYPLSFFQKCLKSYFEQINDHMQSKFSKHLTGFRKNHSTQNALLVMIEKRKTVLNKKLKVGVHSLLLQN